MATVSIVIETPKDSRNKYELRGKKLALDHKLFAPMPVNYGFIPDTKSGDNDNLDVLYFSRAVNKLASLRAKVVGVMRFSDNGKRDDKILCVPAKSRKTLNNLKSRFKYLKYFFETYKCNTQVLGFEGVGKALKAINNAKE